MAEISPGVHRLGSDRVNFYLIEDGGRVTLVDAGLSGYWDQLEPALAGIGPASTTNARALDVGACALAAALACQAGRYWCIATLGRQWNTRVVVVPGLGAVTRGPYRLLRHPNYVVVALEGVALPLVHTAWGTAAGFTALNAVLLLRHRIPAEERALAALTEPTSPRPAP